MRIGVHVRTRAHQMHVQEVSRRLKPHEWSDGTQMFYDSNKDAVIIYNPGAAGNDGTVFIPTDPITGEKRGLDYFLGEGKNDRPPSY